jgi:hypothetical protein
VTLLLQRQPLPQQLVLQGQGLAAARLAVAVMLQWVGWRHFWRSKVHLPTRPQQPRTQQMPLPLRLASAP